MGLEWHEGHHELRIEFFIFGGTIPLKNVISSHKDWMELWRKRQVSREQKSEQKCSSQMLTTNYNVEHLAILNVLGLSCLLVIIHNLGMKSSYLLTKRSCSCSTINFLLLWPSSSLWTKEEEDSLSEERNSMGCSVWKLQKLCFCN